MWIFTYCPQVGTSIRTHKNTTTTQKLICPHTFWTWMREHSLVVVLDDVVHEFRVVAQLLEASNRWQHLRMRVHACVYLYPFIYTNCSWMPDAVMVSSKRYILDSLLRPSNWIRPPSLARPTSSMRPATVDWLCLLVLVMHIQHYYMQSTTRTIFPPFPTSSFMAFRTSLDSQMLLYTSLCAHILSDYW